MTSFSIRKILALLLVSCLLYHSSFAQGTWTKKADFGGAIRGGPIAFSIGTKGYVGTGSKSIGVCLQDFWEWDQATNAWTQKANFSGSGRGSAIGMSIGNKGYVGLGIDINSWALTDFWEYDPITNIWMQKANFPGPKRFNAIGFSIGYKGYIGTGNYGNNFFKDLWEYDALSDVWTKKNNFPGAIPRAGSNCFSIGSKGYLSTGYDSLDVPYNDFWEWDQLTDSWTKKNNLPGTPLAAGVGFSIGNYGYFCTGDSTYYLSSTWWMDYHTSKPYCWRYDPNTDTWKQMANYGGGPRRWAVGFVIGCKGYICAGTDQIANNGTNKKDFWEFTPDGPSAGIAGVNQLCAGDSTYLFASGGENFQWSTGETTNIIYLQPAATTTYSAIVSGSCGADTTSMTVTVNPIPVASFSSQFEPCSRCVQFTDNSHDAMNWNWNFGDSTNSSVQNPQHCFSNTDTLITTLTVYSAYAACWDSIHLPVVTYNPDTMSLFVPNVFTPNGDGDNDVFSLNEVNTCMDYSIKIFNRWGILMFETTLPDKYWDGKTITGSWAEQGVYYYILTSNGENKKGTVTLLR